MLEQSGSKIAVEDEKIKIRKLRLEEQEDPTESEQLGDSEKLSLKSFKMDVPGVTCDDLKSHILKISRSIKIVKHQLDSIKNPIIMEEPLYSIILKNIMSFFLEVISNTKESALVMRLTNPKLKLELDFYLQVQKLMK
jgi:hypothetical protein